MKQAVSRRSTLPRDGTSRAKGRDDSRSLADARPCTAPGSGASVARQVHAEVGDEMEDALDATMILFNVMGGLGLFFIGVGLLWFVSVYKDKAE